MASSFLCEALIFIASLDEDVYAFSMTTKYFSLTLAALLILSVPHSADAASSRPSCSLIVSTPQDTITVRKSADVLLVKDEAVTISWDGSTADSAELNGSKIDIQGVRTFTPNDDTDYELEFKKGSRTVTCSVEVSVVEAKIDSSTLSTEDETPTISGTAENVRSLQLLVYKEGSSRVLVKSKTIRVRNGEWSTTITKKLADGNYTVRLFGPSKTDLNLLQKQDLYIGEKVASSLYVNGIPLLMGGTARANSVLPVSYLQVRNTGKEPASISGFWLRQNGTASTNTIVGFSSVDGTGGSIAATTQTGNQFKSGLAYAPSTAIIPAGGMKLFTIKAIMASNIAPYIGTNLMLDVTGIDSNGQVSGSFPIRGTTFVLGY